MKLTRKTIGIIFLVVLIALVIGLSVGLTQKKKQDPMRAAPFNAGCSLKIDTVGCLDIENCSGLSGVSNGACDTNAAIGRCNVSTVDHIGAPSVNTSLLYNNISLDLAYKNCSDVNKTAGNTATFVNYTNSQPSTTGSVGAKPASMLSSMMNTPIKPSMPMMAIPTMNSVTQVMSKMINLMMNPAIIETSALQQMAINPVAMGKAMMYMMTDPTMLTAMRDKTMSMQMMLDPKVMAVLMSKMATGTDTVSVTNQMMTNAVVKKMDPKVVQLLVSMLMAMSSDQVMMSKMMSMM